MAETTSEFVKAHVDFAVGKAGDDGQCAVTPYAYGCGAGRVRDMNFANEIVEKLFDGVPNAVHGLPVSGDRVVFRIVIFVGGTTGNAKDESTVLFDYQQVRSDYPEVCAAGMGVFRECKRWVRKCRKGVA